MAIDLRELMDWRSRQSGREFLIHSESSHNNDFIRIELNDFKHGFRRRVVDRMTIGQEGFEVTMMRNLMTELDGLGDPATCSQQPLMSRDGKNTRCAKCGFSMPPDRGPGVP